MSQPQRRVLLLAHSFLPLNSAGSFRAAAFARYLPAHGWLTAVATAEWSHEAAYDESLEGRLSSIDVVSRSPNWGGLRAWRKRGSASMLRHPVLAVGKVGCRVLPGRRSFDPLEYYIWTKRTLSEYLRQQQVDLIWATVPPGAPMAVAAWANREFGIPWVADFRDVWMPKAKGAPTATEQRRLRDEHQQIRSAALLTTVSEPLADELRKRHGKPVAVVRNGFDDEPTLGKSSSAPGCFTIAYTGRIYPWQEIERFLAGLRSFLDEPGVDMERVRFDYCGGQGERVLAAAKELGLGQVVRNLGRLAHAVAIKMQRDAVLLLHLTWPEPGSATTKIYEYLAAQRPIIAFPGDRDEVENLLRTTGAGACFASEKDVAAELRRCYGEWREHGRLKYGGRTEDLARFTRRSLSRELAALFDRLVPCG